MGTIIAAIDAVARELMLFAAAGFLLVGFDDLLVDVLWLAARVRARFAPDPRLSEMPRPERPMRFAIFVAAWKEQNVIGGMLRTALDRVEHPDYRIFVGTYPNDPATIAVVRAIAEADPRVLLVIGPRDGCSWPRNWEIEEAGFGGLKRHYLGRELAEICHFGEPEGLPRLFGHFSRPISQFGRFRARAPRGSRLATARFPSSEFAAFPSSALYTLRRSGADRPR